MSVPDSSRSRGGYESREVVGFWGSGPGPPRGEPSAGTAVRSGCSRGSSRRPVRVIIPTNPSTSALFRVGFRLGGHARRGDRGRSSAASSGRILARAINGQRQAARKNPSAGLGGVRVRVPPPTRTTHEQQGRGDDSLAPSHACRAAAATMDTPWFSAGPRAPKST